MRYLVTLKPLTPFLFGGKNTFGTLDDKEEGSYFVRSKYFPQQTTILGMLQKQMMIHAGLLTRKLRGEWVDKSQNTKAQELVGYEKFNFMSEDKQDFKKLNHIGPVFLSNGVKRYIKKVDIDRFAYDSARTMLSAYNSKQQEELYDSYLCIDDGSRITAKDIFLPIEQVGNKKIATKSSYPEKPSIYNKKESENAYFKKTSYRFKDTFCFAFYLECEEGVLPQSSIVSLGADGGKFSMCLVQDDSRLEERNTADHLVLLSDSYIPLPLEECGDFAVTSEVEFVHFYKPKNQKYLHKSTPLFLYQKGSVFFNPSQKLREALTHCNRQQIGFNHYIYQGAQS